jgi:hypothetical protein
MDINGVFLSLAFFMTLRLLVGVMLYDLPSAIIDNGRDDDTNETELESSI